MTKGGQRDGEPEGPDDGRGFEEPEQKLGLEDRSEGKKPREKMRTEQKKMIEEKPPEGRGQTEESLEEGGVGREASRNERVRAEGNPLEAARACRWHCADEKGLAAGPAVLPVLEGTLRGPAEGAAEAQSNSTSSFRGSKPPDSGGNAAA